MAKTRQVNVEVPAATRSCLYLLVDERKDRGLRAASLNAIVTIAILREAHRPGSPLDQVNVARSTPQDFAPLWRNAVSAADRQREDTRAIQGYLSKRLPQRMNLRIPVSAAKLARRLSTIKGVTVSAVISESCGHLLRDAGYGEELDKAAGHFKTQGVTSEGPSLTHA